MNEGTWSFLNGSTFTRAQVLALLAELRPHRETVTLIAYDRRNPYRVILQKNDKCPHLLFPGGALEGEESLIAAVWREVVLQEHPNLAGHLRRDGISKFTDCRVVPTRGPEDSEFRKSLAKFFAGCELPDEVLAFLRLVEVPMFLGSDHVFSAPLEGRVDTRKGTSDEAKEQHYLDLLVDKPTLGYYHATLAQEWIEFVRSGFTKRPTLDKVYRRC